MDRLQKIIANAGVCSRRKAEELIKEGKVTLNGKVATIGQSGDPEQDFIAVNGRRVMLKRRIYLMLNKPRGVIVAKEDKFKKTIFQIPALRKYKDLIHVGRLDQMSEGLLLLTNDGDFANNIMHPRYNIEKTYLVTTTHPLGSQHTRDLERGIFIDKQKTKPAKVKVLPKNSFEITIHEGRNRIIRNMMEQLGYSIISLKRIKVGNLELGTLKPGEVRILYKTELDKIVPQEKKEN